MALLWLCKYALICISPKENKRLNVLTLGGHYGKVKGGYFGNGGHYGPKRADIMVWADTLVGADTMVHDIRHRRRRFCLYKRLKVNYSTLFCCSFVKKVVF